MKNLALPASLTSFQTHAPHAAKIGTETGKIFHISGMA